MLALRIFAWAYLSHPLSEGCAQFKLVICKVFFPWRLSMPLQNQSKHGQPRAIRSQCPLFNKPSRSKGLHFCVAQTPQTLGVHAHCNPPGGGRGAGTYCCYHALHLCDFEWLWAHTHTLLFKVMAGCCSVVLSGPPVP